MKKIVPILLFTLVFVVTNSCRRDKYIPNVCFNENILPIFISKCGSVGCHSSSSGGKHENRSLTNYDEIMKGITPNHPALSEYYTKISGKNPEMPPKNSPQLTAKELENIKFWINFGAPNSSCGGTTCDTLTYITYNTHIKPIMDLWCIGCHNSSSASTTKLDSYNGMKTAIGAGRILGSIKHQSGYLAMPDGGGALSSCEILQIEKWVSNGMPQ